MDLEAELATSSVDMGLAIIVGHPFSIFQKKASPSPVLN